MRAIKKIAVVGVATTALIGGGVAYAYWTSTGDGSGQASTGTSSLFSVSTDAAVVGADGPMTPGGPSETVPVHVTNPSTGHQILRTVHVTVANKADGSTWTAVSGCSSADYTVVDPTLNLPVDLGPGGVWDGTITISMNNNTTSSQDGCKGATVPLFVHAS